MEQKEKRSITNVTVALVIWIVILCVFGFLKLYGVMSMIFLGFFTGSLFSYIRKEASHE